MDGSELECVRLSRFDVGACPFLVASTAAREAAVGALTRAEREVALLSACGATNLEVARARGTSVSTVANQVAAIFRKLGVFSRLQLAAVLGVDDAAAGPREPPTSPSVSASAPERGPATEHQAALRRHALAADSHPDQLCHGAAAWERICGGEWAVLDHFHLEERYFLVLRSARGTGGGYAPIPPFGRALLLRVALGDSSKAIAIDLGVAPSTISVLLAHLFARMGIRCRVAVAQVLGPLARATGATAEASPCLDATNEDEPLAASWDRRVAGFGR